MTISNPMSPIRFVNRSAPTVGCGVEFCFCVQTALTTGQKLTVKGVHIGLSAFSERFTPPKKYPPDNFTHEVQPATTCPLQQSQTPSTGPDGLTNEIGRQCNTDVETRAQPSLQPRMIGPRLLKLGRWLEITLATGPLTLFLAWGGDFRSPLPLRFFVCHCQTVGDSELNFPPLRGIHCRHSVKFLEPG